MLAEVALLGAETGRTRAYIDLLDRVGLAPGRCLLMRGGPAAPARPAETDLFDNLTPAAEAARRAGIETTELEAADINAPEVVAQVAALAQTVVLFSGPGGAIVREGLFATRKRFLHAHPGRLPEFRGSTTIYYGLLAEERITVTALLLAPEIDGGPVVGQAAFPPPADRTSIDLAYDPYVRARLIADVLGAYARTGRFEEAAQPEAGAETYHIVHPVLKHLAILAGAARPGP